MSLGKKSFLLLFIAILTIKLASAQDGPDFYFTIDMVKLPVSEVEDDFTFENRNNETRHNGTIVLRRRKLPVEPLFASGYSTIFERALKDPIPGRIKICFFWVLTTPFLKTLILILIF